MCDWQTEDPCLTVVKKFLNWRENAVSFSFFLVFFSSLCSSDQSVLSTWVVFYLANISVYLLFCRKVFFLVDPLTCFSCFFAALGLSSTCCPPLEFKGLDLSFPHLAHMYVFFYKLFPEEAILTAVRFWSLISQKYTQMDGRKKNQVNRPRNLLRDKVRERSIEKWSWWFSIHGLKCWIFAVSSKYNWLFFHCHRFLYNPLFFLTSDYMKRTFQIYRLQENTSPVLPSFSASYIIVWKTEFIIMFQDPVKLKLLYFITASLRQINLAGFCQVKTVQSSALALTVFLASQSRYSFLSMHKIVCASLGAEVILHTGCSS